MEEIIITLLNHVPTEYAIYATLLCGVCSVICTFWKAPTPEANGFIKFIYKVVNILGMNFGKAQNADDKEQEEHQKKQPKQEHVNN